MPDHGSELRLCGFEQAYLESITKQQAAVGQLSEKLAALHDRLESST